MIEGLLCLLPALVLATVLLVRRYPGAGALTTLRRRRARTRWPRARSITADGRPLVLIVARGGQLIARSLAVRPPPRPLTTS